jgi:hypothetical protein
MDWWVESVDGGPPIRTGAYSSVREHVLDMRRSITALPNTWHRGSVIFSAAVGETDTCGRSQFPGGRGPQPAYPNS